MDDVPAPPWVLGEAPWPDGLGSVVYLDNADDTARVAPVLELWHELAVGLLPRFAPDPAALSSERLKGTTQDPAGRERKVRPRRWADGITDELFQLTAGWTYTGPRPGEEYGLSIYAFRFRGRRHLQLMTSLTLAPGLLAGAVPAVLDLTAQVADAGDAAYGEVAVNRQLPAPDTEVDVFLRRSTLVSADESRTVLRGYGWVTVVPRELVRRLGGGSALGDAFFEVRELGSGGAMLRATERPDEFGPAPARRVLDALRPVLPPGLDRVGADT